MDCMQSPSVLTQTGFVCMGETSACSSTHWYHVQIQQAQHCSAGLSFRNNTLSVVISSLGRANTGHFKACVGILAGDRGGGLGVGWGVGGGGGEGGWVKGGGEDRVSGISNRRVSEKDSRLCVQDWPEVSAWLTPWTGKGRLQQFQLSLIYFMPPPAPPPPTPPQHPTHRPHTQQPLDSAAGLSLRSTVDYVFRTDLTNQPGPLHEQ